MHVEHYRLRSRYPAQRNVYSNCFLICRLCNLARGVAPIRSPKGYRLINPCHRAWGDAFELIGDEIRPRDTSDRDAIYTCDSYDLNDPHKVRMRKLRRETIESAQRYLIRSRHLEQELRERARATGDPVLLDAAELIKSDRRDAYWDLEQFLAVPHDHDKVCRCHDQRYHTLPKSLAERTIEIVYDV